MTSDYAWLEARFRRIGILRSTLGVLRWDAAAVMPDGARAVRGEQLAEIEGMVANLLLEDEVTTRLAAARPSDDWESANLREMTREVLQASAIPAHLQSELIRLQSECEGIWIEARKEGDFARVRKPAARLLSLTREVANARAESLSLEPHEALMDLHDPGIRTRDIDPLFDTLVNRLPDLVRAGAANSEDRRDPARGLPIPEQLALCRRLADHLGYDFRYGRLDTSAQACFADDCPDDVRITVSPDPEDFRRALYGAAHEIGHSFYENRLPARWRYQPVGRPCSAAMQESQAILFEKIVMGAPDFYAATLSAITGNPTSDSGLRPLRLGLMRQQADEASYPLHIVLRYRIEKDLINGCLEVSDLPSAWEEGCEKIFNLRPKTPAEGCLQDIHWYRGLYGYFQSYGLGYLIAAQLHEAAILADPAIAPGLASGDIAGLRSWLERTVYSEARRSSAADVVNSATGRPLGADAFFRHLEGRYLTGPGARPQRDRL